jgi:hypothetical protein
VSAVRACRQRDTAHAVLFGHNRQLPRRRPMELIGARGDFASADGLPFDAFGTLTGSQTQSVTA